MHRVQVVEAKAHFSALLAEVEAGGEVEITKRGKVVARLVPDKPRMAADLFRTLWDGEPVDLEAPNDAPPEPVNGFD